MLEVQGRGPSLSAGGDAGKGTLTQYWRQCRERRPSLSGGGIVNKYTHSRNQGEEPSKFYKQIYHIAQLYHSWAYAQRSQELHKYLLAQSGCCSIHISKKRETG